MRNVLLVGESYSGGVKTYIDTIMMNAEHVPQVHFHALVSSKRLENGERIGENYLTEDNLSFGKSPLKLIAALKTLHRVVREKEIDVVHANSTYAGILMYLYTFVNRKAVYVYTPHGYYSLKNMGQMKKAAIRFVEKQMNKSSDLIIHVSPSEEREAIRYKLTTAEKSVVVLNGSKDPGIVPIRAVNGVFTIANLARVDDQKNPFDFIEIARKVLEMDLPVQFIWAGSGKYLDEARSKVKSYGLEDEIKFIGFSNDKHEILKQADMLLSTSHYEGLPFAVIEAMSYKLPLLLTDIVGHTDLIEDKENGLLFKNKEDPVIYEFVRELVEDDEKWKSLSNASYRIFKERFHTKQMLKRLVSVYQMV